MAYDYANAARIRLTKFSEKKNSGCIEWTRACNASGYGIIRFNRRVYLCHRAAYELFVCAIPDGIQVLHHCDNRKCINIEHLFLGTNSDNVADRVSKSRSASFPGEDNPAAILSERQVLEILESKDSRPSLAKKYGVSLPLIHKIKQRNVWKHIAFNP